MPRQALSQTIRQLVLLEAGYRCANPRCNGILTLEIHHIVWVRDGGANDPDNLLALCPNCHALHTAGHIPRVAIETWKAMLVALTNRVTVDLLLVLHQDEQRPADDATPRFRFTGDGLAILAGPLASGILEITRRYSGLGCSGSTMPSFEVRLTEKGRRLVLAWLEGSPEGIQAALVTPLSSPKSDPP